MLNENIDVNDLNAFNLLMECHYCGDFFSKSNKPLILNCFHNICEACHGINLQKVECMLCHAKYEGKSNKRHPINFILLEIIEKTLVKENEEKKERKLSAHKSKFKKTKSLKSFQTGQAHVKDRENEIGQFFHCSKCDLNFPNKFHFENFPDHQLIIENKKNVLDKKQGLLEKSGELMKRYKNFNEKLEKFHVDFFEFFKQRMKLNMTYVANEFKMNNLLDNLLISGFINKADQQRLNEFVSKYLFDENISALMKNSKTFDELFINLKKEKEFNINNFISSFFYFEEILEKKLKIIMETKNCEQLKEKIKSFINKLHPNATQDDDIKSLFKYFIQDLSVEAIACLNLDKDLNKKFKLPVLLTNTNELIVLNPLTEKLKNFGSISSYFTGSDTDNLQASAKSKYAYSLDTDYNIYITGGTTSLHDCIKDNTTTIVSSDFFSINLLTNTKTSLKNMPEPRYDHNSIIINNKLFIIGGKKENNLPDKSCLNYNITKNTWNKMQDCPYEFIQKPVLLNFENDFIYAFDDLKHFFNYDINSNIWELNTPSFKDDFHLNIINFCAICHDGNILILGGSVTDAKGSYPNENIYEIKHSSCFVTKKGEFKMDADFSCIDSGYLIDYNYLLLCDSRVRVYKSKDLSSMKWDELHE